MPMTLKRHVNGHVVPIKLSIFDALVGSPTRRRKKGAKQGVYMAEAKPRSISKNEHKDLNRLVYRDTSGPATDGICAQKIAAAPATTPTATAATRTVQAQAAPAAATASVPGSSTTITKQGEDEAHTFTAADDAKLIEMKAAGRTWKEIVAEMKKSQSGLKERFKEIGSNVDVNAGGGQGGKKTDGEAQPHKANNPNSKAKKDANSTIETAAKSSTTTTSPSNPKPNLKPWPADKDTPTLAEIAAKYDRDKWRFAASKYYDLTGVRISKEQAEMMAAEVAAEEEGKKREK